MNGLSGAVRGGGGAGSSVAEPEVSDGAERAVSLPLPELCHSDAVDGGGSDDGQI